MGLSRDIVVDVLVCGGGMAGTVAAVAAARNGAQVLLVERWGFLGGSATAGAVGQFVGWETAAARQVIHGLAEEVVQRLERHEIGRGSCRERVEILVVAVSLKKKRSFKV